MGEMTDDVSFVAYENELQMPGIMRLIEKDLSEPYSIFTYRYFINNWPQLCYLAMSEGNCVAVIICKLDRHREALRGYIAMLAVDKTVRKKGIGSRLVVLAINQMQSEGCDEVVLEAEVTNSGALALYEKLGFLREKRLHKYYLNGGDAFRLKVFLHD
mmetsp:Transcript_5211/g.8974  ORF Transcript_5211/g.8974 Transcript_5211/m.8974 type:complete len:158 (+) Transcript_5211:56-529(+)|eukprot:CAMPEP_0196660090 /NCGR_PEP_ID=MMETSP1086-20130531/38063_1 /TAXON_ID=77921 /ORGANISM="Cyanoptyche  gloeocystis , Strain SAG4.97" /LENGTH=157 /DNA_ID=CAMNT_0041994341 /DNA_START=46 /DNA_END=519 /DNA_ORIENTATION=+